MIRYIDIFCMSGLNNRSIHTVIIQRAHIHIHMKKQEKEK